MVFWFRFSDFMFTDSVERKASRIVLSGWPMFVAILIFRGYLQSLISFNATYVISLV